MHILLQKVHTYVEINVCVGAQTKMIIRFQSHHAVGAFMTTHIEQRKCAFTIGKTMHICLRCLRATMQTTTSIAAVLASEH